MEEGAAAAAATVTGDTIPDLKDIEMKIGRKTPEGLLRCLREEASSLRGDVKQGTAAAGAQDPGTKEPGRKSLDEKIRKLKMEMAHLRSVDVKILQQLLAVHEGIEAVKWLLEERSTLTSRCSSLTSSQYSLGEGPDTSWRGSWSSLQDPIDKLDNISVGSYLDTLADDMDEYCPSSSESVICSTTPLVSEATAGSRTGMVVGVRSVTGAANGIRANENGVGAGNVMEVKGGEGPGVVNGRPAVPVNSAQVKPEGPKQDAPVWTRAAETGKGSPVLKDNIQAQSIKVNGIREKALTQNGSPTRTSLGTNQSPKLKPYKNGKIELDSCKMNGKMHLEYDAHWRWVQSQEDVTFL